MLSGHGLATNPPNLLARISRTHPTKSDSSTRAGSRLNSTSGKGGNGRHGRKISAPSGTARHSNKQRPVQLPTLIAAPLTPRLSGQSHKGPYERPTSLGRDVGDFTAAAVPEVARGYLFLRLSARTQRLIPNAVLPNAPRCPRKGCGHQVFA